jgi:hypothetical protein
MLRANQSAMPGGICLCARLPGSAGPFPSSLQQINPSHAHGAHPAMLKITAMVRSKPMQKIGE